MKLFIAISLLLIGNICFSQTFTPRTNGTFTPVDPYLSVPRALYIPKVCDTLVNPLHGGKDSVGAMVIDTCNQKVWIRTRVGSTKIWLQFSSIISEQHPVNWYNIKNAGADATGIIDASPYIIAAMNSGIRDIYLPKGTYLLSNTVQMKDSVTIRGDGRQATVIKLAANTVGFKLGFALGGFKCQFLDIGFLGTDSTSGNGTQTGILIDSVNGVFVHNVGGYLLGGWTVRIRRNGYCCGTYTTTAPRGNIISNCYSQKCYGGYALDTVAEYNTIDNSTAVNGVYGAFIAGGNSRLNNNNLSSNTYGAYLTGGSNNAHGVAVGNTFNHNGYNIYVTGATNGFTFSANACYAASTQEVYIDNSDNVNFYGGAILVGTVTSINNTNCTFSNVRMSAPVWTITGNAPTVIVNGAIQNTLSIKDVLNSNQLDISHLNKVVNFTVPSGGKFMFSDTVFTKYIAAGTANNDTLHIMATTRPTPTQSGIQFGVDNSANGVRAGYWDMRTGYVGINTRSVAVPLHVRNLRPGANAELRLSEDTTCGSCAARITFENNGNVTGGQIFVGGTTNAFMPRGMMIQTGGADGLKLATGGAAGQDIEFAGSVSIGITSWGRFKGGTGNFLIGTSTDNTIGKLQVNGKVTIATIDSTTTAMNILYQDPADGQIYKSSVPSGGGGMAIGGAITGGTDGSVLFRDGGNLAEDNPNFFWNNTSNRLGIGNNAPGYKLHVTGDAALDGGALLFNGGYPGVTGYPQISAYLNQFLINANGLLFNNMANTTGLFAVGATGLFNVYSIATGVTPPTTTGTTKMVITDQNGLLSFANIPLGTLQDAITAGATLSAVNTIVAGNNAQTFTGTQGAGDAYTFSNTGNGGALAASGNGSGVTFKSNNSSSGTAIFGSSVGGVGGYFTSTNNIPIYARASPGTTSSVVTTLITGAGSSGTTAAGFGNAWDMQLEDDAGSDITGASLRSVFTSAATASPSTKFQIYNMNSGSLSLVANFDKDANATFGTTNSIVGTATNNNAVAGNIGEETNSTISTYTNYTTTATYQNVTSITLTAGDWDLSAFFTYSSNSATITAAANAIFVISTTTASAAGATEGKNISYIPQAALLGTSLFSDAISPYRVSISGTTTYYLNTQAAFTLGNPQYAGTIRARRVR